MQELGNIETKEACSARIDIESKSGSSQLSKSVIENLILYCMKLELLLELMPTVPIGNVVLIVPSGPDQRFEEIPLNVDECLYWKLSCPP